MTKKNWQVISNNRNSLLICFALIVISAILLIIQHYTDWEFMFHLAALPLEVLLAIFVVELFLQSRERKRRRLQLMYIKSCMFRLEMRPLFIANFAALKSPSFTMADIRAATLPELRKMRADANMVAYQSLEMMETVLMEYVRSQSVWHDFMDMALKFGLEDIFQDMVYILHLINDFKAFKENYPDKSFMHEVVDNNEQLMKKVMNVLGDGIRKFLDYAIELNEKQPKLFEEIISGYQRT